MFRFKLLLRNFADCVRQMRMVLGVLNFGIRRLMSPCEFNLSILLNFAINTREENRALGFGLCFKLDVSLCCGNCLSSAASKGGSGYSATISAQSPARNQKVERIKSAPSKLISSESSGHASDGFCSVCDFPRKPLTFAYGGHFEQRILLHRPPAASRLSHTPAVLAFGFEMNVDSVLSYLVNISSIPSSTKVPKKNSKKDVELGVSFILNL